MSIALVMALSVQLAVHAAPKPKRPKPPPAPATLADVKPGDFVEYDVTVGVRGVVTAFTLRLEAVEVTSSAIVIDARSRGSARPAWLERGVRLRLALTGKAPEPERSFAESTRDDTKPESRTVAGRTFACRAWGVQTFDGPKGGGCREAPARELALGNGLVEEAMENKGWGEAEGHSIRLSAFGHVEPGTADAGVALTQRWGDGTVLSVRAPADELAQESLRSVGGRWLVSHTDLRAAKGARPGIDGFDAKEWETGRKFELTRTALEQVVALVELESRGLGLWPCDWCEGGGSRPK